MATKLQESWPLFGSTGRSSFKRARFACALSERTIVIIFGISLANELFNSFAVFAILRVQLHDRYSDVCCKGILFEKAPIEWFCRGHFISWNVVTTK